LAANSWLSGNQKGRASTYFGGLRVWRDRIPSETQAHIGISRNSARSKELSGHNLSIFGLAVFGVVLCVPRVLTAQHTKPDERKEQSKFGIEDPALQRPVILVRAALDALSKDERVASCLESEGLTANELPPNWFRASEIHLDGPNEGGLVVLPGDPLPATPAGEMVLPGKHSRINALDGVASTG
jgi:hypothetical protein